MTQGKEDDNALRLWIEIVRLANGLQRDVDSRLRKTHGESLSRFDVLSQLDRVPGNQLPVGQLSSRLLTPTNNITRLLDRMEKDGLLTRELSETDRRSFTVRATRDGLTTFRRMAADNREWIAQAFSSLSPSRIQRLTHSLSEIKGSVRIED